MLAPIHIKFMLACHCSGDPENTLGSAHWNSSAGHDTKQWLIENDLIDENNRSTPRGRAWVQFICQTPLPVATWTLPERSRDEIIDGEYSAP